MSLTKTDSKLYQLVYILDTGRPNCARTPIIMDGYVVLDQLVDIITAGVADIKRAYIAADAMAPSLDQP
jgi:hypothetical protein